VTESAFIEIIILHHWKSVTVKLKLVGGNK